MSSVFRSLRLKIPFRFVFVRIEFVRQNIIHLSRLVVVRLRVPPPLTKHEHGDRDQNGSHDANNDAQDEPNQGVTRKGKICGHGNHWTFRNRGGQCLSPCRQNDLRNRELGWRHGFDEVVVNEEDRALVDVFYEERVVRGVEAVEMREQFVVGGLVFGLGDDGGNALAVEGVPINRLIPTLSFVDDAVKPHRLPVELNCDVCFLRGIG